MSKIALEPNAAGTGTFSIASPNSNTNRTLTLPDIDGAIVTMDTSGNVGIGTSSPSVAAGSGLVINGGADQGRLAIKTNSTGDAAGDGFQIAVGTDSSVYIEQRENNIMGFSTNAIARMIIDAAGRVTLPYQPSFLADHTDSTLTTGDIIWTGVKWNTGGHYNPSNGRFTAPVTGVYFFRAHTLTGYTNGGEVRMAIYVNGGDGSFGLRYITIKPANNWWTTHAHGHVRLNAGDYVTICMEMNPGTLYPDAGYNAFSGHLVG